MMRNAADGLFTKPSRFESHPDCWGGFRVFGLLPKSRKTYKERDELETAGERHSGIPENSGMELAV
jgi:hypothetical protein